MESSVETLKCSSCGALMEMTASGTAQRCPKCGNLPNSPRSKAAPDAADGGNSIRDFLLRAYNRVLIVLLVYVLSTGPLYWSIYEAFHNTGSPFLAKLYLPIVFACEQSETICNWFDWYVGLWVY